MNLIYVVMAFVEMTKFLLPEEKSLFFLSERISQGPIENYFSRQRARGGRNENLTLQQCIYNAAALRVQKSVALDRGGSRNIGEGGLDIGW